MRIRVGEVEFGIESAEVRYTRVPNGTIAVDLDVVGERRDGLHLTLAPPPLPGRVLADLTGQLQIISSPTKPDADDARAVNIVAGIYVGTHELVMDSRVAWGATDERGISVRWTGVVDDLDAYDGSQPRQPLVVDVHATAVEVPHPWVSWRATHAEEDEYPHLDGLRDGVVNDLTAELVARKWFDGLPFVTVELVAQVEARGRRWEPLPPRVASAPQRIVAKLTRAVVKSGDPVAIRRALDAEIASGLEQLERRYRQGAPKLL